MSCRPTRQGTKAKDFSLFVLLARIRIRALYIGLEAFIYLQELCARYERRVQREGMGLPKYQAMPSLRDVAHDGVLCTFSNRSATDRGKLCDPSAQAAWTVHHVQNHTLLGGTILQPAKGAAVLGQPSSLQPHRVE
jgi:hypothetical protein